MHPGMFGHGVSAFPGQRAHAPDDARKIHAAMAVVLECLGLSARCLPKRRRRTRRRPQVLRRRSGKHRQEIYKAFDAAGHGGVDFSGIVQHVRALAGKG